MKKLLAILACAACIEAVSQTTPLPDPGTQAMETVWLHPIDSPAETETFQWIELGFRLQMATRRKIDNYIADRQVPNRLNPFDPADLDVRMRFSLIDSLSGDTLRSLERNAFWYRSFRVDSTATDPDDWTHTEVPTPFNFRTRFTPPEAGRWAVTGMVIENQRDTTYTNTTYFNVTAERRPSFLAVGPSKRYLIRDGRGFFPIGQNLPVPSCRPESDARCAEMECAGQEAWCFGRMMSPLGFDVYHNEMRLLAENGGNYFRLLLAPWALEIEFEKLNNYHDRMHMAWETDRILEEAEKLGLLIHLNLHIHFPFEDPSGYGMWQWDWSDLPCFDYDDPYCYCDELNLPKPIDFLKSEAAMRHYKNRLRYLIARYGHSTNIGVLELLSEANNVGAGNILDENCATISSPPRPYISEPGFAKAVADWHKELARFIKEDLNHTDHLVAVSYTGPPSFTLGDDSFYSEHVDLATYNHYNLAVDKYYRTAQTVEQFQSNRRKPSLSDFNPPAINKPLFFSEVGPGPEEVAFCDNDIRWQKEAWLSPFIGLAGMGLNWSNQYRADLWRQFRHINTLFSTVDLEAGRFVTYRSESDDKRFELLALRSRKGQRQAIGVVHNRTVNFYSVATDTASVCRSSDWLIDDLVRPQFREAQTLTHTRGDKASVIENMGSLQRYSLRFIHPETGETLSTVSVRSGISGRLRIPYPSLQADGVALYAFKVVRDTGSREQ
jgi:hypothetical protein